MCDNFQTVRDWVSVSINYYQDVAYGLSIGTDIGDIEWPLTM